MEKLLRGTLVVVLLIGFFFVSNPAAQTTDFPKKPIKLVVTAGPGGGEDVEARGIAPFVEKHLGVSVSIENQAGAGGKIAFEKFQKTAPDGYTLITYSFPKSIVLEYMDKVNFKTKDFTPIYAWSRSDQMLVVHVDGWKTFDEFIKVAKGKTLSGGLSGRGSLTHLAGLVAINELGIKVNWVPYDSATGSTAALAGKHLDFTICLPTSGAPLIDAGKIRPLIIFGDRRDPYFPDVPIPKDLGYNMPNLQAIRGVEAPPNTPPSIIKVLEESFSKAVKEPGFIDFSKKRKMVLQSLSAQEYSVLVAETYPKIEKVHPLLKD